MKIFAKHKKSFIVILVLVLTFVLFSKKLEILYIARKGLKSGTVKADIAIARKLGYLADEEELLWLIGPHPLLFYPETEITSIPEYALGLKGTVKAHKILEKLANSQNSQVWAIQALAMSEDYDLTCLFNLYKEDFTRSVILVEACIDFNRHSYNGLIEEFYETKLKQKNTELITNKVKYFLEKNKKNINVKSMTK